MKSYTYKLTIEVDVITANPEAARRALARRTILPLHDQGCEVTQETSEPEDWTYTEAPCPHLPGDALIIAGTEA